MTRKSANEVLNIMRGLSTDEKKSLVDQILKMVQLGDEDGASKRDDLVSLKNGRRPDCPHCGGAAAAGYIVRKGVNKNGAQRFYCKACGRFFVPATGTAFARTRKKADIWRRFIELTIAGSSIALCSEECGLTVQTAFTWRHKLLNVFKVAQDSTRMTGWVEADELMIPLSYKGNHIQGKPGERRSKGYGVDTRMPRPALKRGSDNRVKSSKERACVFCMVENANQAFYAAVPGVGFMNKEMLDATVAKRVDKSSALMLVDQYKVTRTYLEENNFQSVVLSSNTSDNPHEHKPEIRGANRDIHLQHVNAMHTHLRTFLKGYCGVSSKYLSNYVSMYVWLKNNNALGRRNAILDLTKDRAAQGDCYISGREIESLPTIPTCREAVA